MAEEHEDGDEKNLRRLTALNVAILILSLLIASYGIYVVVKQDSTSTSPGVTYATLVIAILAALTSLISAITFYMENSIVAYSAALFHLMAIILEVIMGVLMIVLQKEILFGSLILVGGVLSVIGFLIGLAILFFRIF
ncbi:hypothetical protein ACTXT7_017519 [Hymenolepis weldensis]